MATSVWISTFADVDIGEKDDADPDCRHRTQTRKRGSPKTAEDVIKHLFWIVRVLGGAPYVPLGRILLLSRLINLVAAGMCFTFFEHWNVLIFGCVFNVFIFF